MLKEIENQPRLKKLNLKSNLTCNIYNGLYLEVLSTVLGIAHPK